MNITPFLEASFAIRLHILAAIAAFIIGGIVLFRRKGDRLHRIGGRIWVALMLIVSFSSFFIHVIQMFGIWSPIHLLSVFTPLALVYGIKAAWMRNIAAHRKTMQSTYAGALLIAGFFTFMPGRMMHDVFFGGSSPLTGMAILAILIIPTGWMIWRGLNEQLTKTH